MRNLLKLAKRLRCLRLGHNYAPYPGTPNMYVCKRCKEPGWMV